MNPTQIPADDDVRRELEEIAPQLSNLKHEDGFSVPHNYFKELPDQVMQRIAEQEQRIPAWQLWLERLRPRTAYAFTLAGVMVLVVAGMWLYTPQPQQDLLVSITEEEALQYVIANMDEYTSEELWTVNAEWDMEETEIQIPADDLDAILDDVIQNADAEFIEELF